MATRWTSKHTGQKIDDTIDCVCNPNLLDNWYFGKPVNQRGKTEHTGNATGYFIDRWKLGGYNQTVTITNSGLHWSTTTGIWCTQVLENFDELIGRTLTLSAIIDGVLYSVTGVLNESSGIGMQPVGSLFVELTHSEKGFRFVTYSDPTPTVTILAAKLELGSQQTLAHQDADGNWVLNEIPDYGEQLRRCQRHLFVPTTQTDSIYNLAIGVGTSTTTITFFLPLPTTMRAKSSITFSGLRATNAVNSMLDITNVANYGQVDNGVWLHATVASGAEVGKAYYLRTSNPWSLVLEANL